jgi:hypothetical protein
MASSSKIMHGARAIVQIKGKQVGLFTNVSYGSTYDVQPAYILGRFSPAELAYVGAEPISISAQGFRVIGQGPYVSSQMPLLQNLLTAEDMDFSIYDRQTNQLVMKVTGVRHTGFNTSVAPRALEEMSLNFIGLRLSDESVDNNEDGTGAATLP